MGNSAVFLLGTDIGTQGTKTVLVDLQGKVISSSFFEYDVLKPRPLWAEQWPEVWHEATCRTIKESVEKGRVDASKIRGLCVSGLYGGSGIPVDREMNPVRPCLIWMDRRATDEVEWIRKNIDLDELFRITGNLVDSYYGFTKILWIKNKEPENWKKISKFIPPNDYVIYRLTGELAIDYSSAGNLGGLFDLGKRSWSTTLAKELGIPKDYMPQNLVNSCDIVGKITKEASRLTGLREGTPVVAGGIDAAVATLSAGAFEEGDHVAMVGTSMCWGIVHHGKSLSKKLVSMPYVAYPDSKIYTWGGAATAGALVRWFREEFGQIEKEAGKLLNVDPFSILDLGAKEVPPGSDGLVVLPYFMGERSPIWDPNARGTILGLTLYHGRAHIYRALLEGVAYAMRDNIEVGKKVGMKLKKTCILVGGASKSELWRQIFADVTEYPQVTIKGEIGAPLGDALLAGVGTGVIESYEKIKEWLNFNQPAEPISENTRIYRKLFTQYLDIYKNIKKNMKALGEVS